MLINPTHRILLPNPLKPVFTALFFCCLVLTPATLPAQAFSAGMSPDIKISGAGMTSQIDSFCGTAFFKRLFIQGQSTAGYNIVPAPNGNFFLATSVNEKTMVILVDKNMEMIWTQTMDLGAGNDAVTDMRLDAEGQIIGVGNAGGAPVACFAFKMNAVTGQLIWRSQLNSPINSYFTRILEKSNGADNYFLFGQTDAVGGTGCNTLLMEINRNTGQLIWDRHYTLGSCEAFYDVYIENNQIYTCGRYNLNGGGQAGFRAALTVLDMDGNVQWSRHYLRSMSQTARLHANELLPDNGGIVLFGWGSDVSISLTETAFQLMKTDSAGALEWAKKYEVAGGNEERAFRLINLPDGYLMCGTFVRPGAAGKEIGLIKTEKNGDFLWGKSYGINGEDRLNDVLLLADTLYLIGSTQKGGIFDILVGKLDLDGNVDAQCPFVKPLDLAVSDYPDPLDDYHTLTELNVTHNYSTAALPVQGVENVTTEAICQKICDTGCDTVQLSQIVEFCPNDTVFIGGEAYTQPGTVLDTISGTGTDCDTLVTYTLQLYQNPTVQIQCPVNINVEAASGANTAIVNYDIPTANSDCPCSPATAELLQGLAAGSNFPLGATQVCYMASDDCGGSNSCCFTVTVQNAPPEDACDVKTTPCVKFEILGIFQNPAKQKTYRMRVTNFCTNKLIYTTFQLPDGLTADAPATNTTYTAPSGRQYEVRNPNFSPAYSIRFKAIGNGISGGQSDVFEYTLPQQAEPLYIHATARLDPQVYVETHLNVFGCEVQQISSRPTGVVNDRQSDPDNTPEDFAVFPNPVSDAFFVQLPSAWSAQRVQLRVTDTYGRQLFHQTATAETNLLTLELPANWPAGLCYLEITNEQGERRTGRFVRAVQR